jgi:hypothetical protein
MTQFFRGPVKKPCGDCVDDYCTMNCSNVEIADFDYRPMEFVGVTTPTLIYNNFGNNPAPSRHQRLRLIDGPAVDNKSWRTAMVERMANDLIEDGATNDKRDAVRCLFRRGCYKSLDIAHLVDDARQAAQQTIVAREMSAP